MGKFTDWLGGHNLFDQWIKDSSEKKEEAAREENLELWRGLQSGGPSVNALMGLTTGMAGEAPDDYIESYINENLASRVNPDDFASGYTVDPDSLFYREDAAAASEASASEALAKAESEARKQLEAEARERWLDEQVARDPYFGLNQYARPESADVAADPLAIEAQHRALQQMQGIYDAGGYTDVERGQLQMAQRDAGLYEQQQRNAAMQQAAMRGTSGGGVEMMGVLGAQQSGANRANDWANQIAVEGQQRALQALQSGASLGGQMRDQSFQEDARRRAAIDAWNSSNVDLRNAWTAQRGAAAGQAYGYQMQAASGLSNALLGESQHYQNESDVYGERRRENFANVGSLMGGMGGGGGGGTSGGGEEDED